jgi:hypothetical protein
MAERVLRGSRLGAVSYETDRNAELAPRQVIEFACSHGHKFTVPFSDEAEIPRSWDCKVCGEPALLVHGELPEPKKVKPARTHWDMLLERRTLPDLEEVLAERLQVLHDRQGLKSA